MRKLILISAFVLASVSAQAGGGRSLTLATNDAPAAATMTTTTETKAEATKADATTADTAKPQASSKQASRSKSAPRHESDETKARRIAAKYGVYW